MENEINPNREAGLSWLDKDVKRFKDIGYLIPKAQVRLYSRIRDFWVQGRTVIDVGSSIGVGSNILSHSARHVWGIDINEEAVRFANSTFARPNLSFEVVDIENPPTRELSKFEVVVMSEVIEHLTNPEAGLNFIKRFFNPKLQTIGFITAPNTNNERVKNADSRNSLHIQHWTAGEFYALLIKHFQSVVLYNNDVLKNWDQSETMDGAGVSELVVAKVEGVL